MKCIWNNVTLFLLFSVIAIILLIPILSNTTLPYILDFFNHITLITQANMALAEGQFPLRVAPTEMAGFHYPIFQFYSPTSYTMAALIFRWITPHNAFMAYKITLGCALIAGEFCMYQLIYWLFKNKPIAILSSIAYITSPYIIITINQIAAFNEVIALCILPAVLYYSFRCYFDAFNLTSVLLTGLAWYLLATIHLVTFIYTSFFVALLLLLLSFKINNAIKNIIKIMLGYFFGCLLAMWFLAPIQKLASYFVVAKSFKEVNTQPFIYLLSPMAHFTSENILALSIHPSIGLPMLLAIGISCYLIFIRNQYQIKQMAWLLPLIILFFIAFFLVWSPFDIWSVMPDILKAGQYSWRLLGQVIWIGALLMAFALQWLFDSKLKSKYIIIGSSLLFLTTAVWLPITEVSHISTNKIKSSLSSSQNAYLIEPSDHPQMIQLRDQALNQNAALGMSMVLPVKNVIPYCEQIQDRTRCVLSVPVTTQLIELPIFYYPELLNITINGKGVPYASIFYDYYLIAGVKPDPGQVNVIEFQFRGLLWANYISAMAWGLLLILSAYLLLRRIFPKNV
jgi:hypothetical protein